MRSIIQQEYHIRLQLRYRSDHINTDFSSFAFSAAALAGWNSLDINTRSAETFLISRCELRTKLFRKSHDTWTLGCAPDAHAMDIFGTLHNIY